MEIISIPTEQTTAATDLLLSLLALFAAVVIVRHRHRDAFKAHIWVSILALLGVAALLGAIIHGVVLSPQSKQALNHGLSLSLGLLVAIFVVAVIYDLFGLFAAKRTLPFMLIIAAGFFLLRLSWSGSFLVFIIYQSLAMLFALAGYCWLAGSKRRGAILISLGVLTSLTAAAVQALQLVSFTFVWDFDHNGVYHLIQMASVVLFVVGLQMSLTVKESPQPN